LGVIHALNVDREASIVSECQCLISVNDLLLAASTSNSSMLGIDSSSAGGVIVELLKEDLRAAILRKMTDCRCHVSQGNREPMPVSLGS